MNTPSFGCAQPLYVTCGAHTRAAACRCSLADHRARDAQPLSRAENQLLMARMLQLAVHEQDFNAAARIRDRKHALDASHPTAHLRLELQRALERQDFSRACCLRDAIDTHMVMLMAERAKPKFAIGLVVIHKLLGYRMLLFGVDYRCRTARGHENWRCALIQRGEDQPWYHAAVDERDKTSGDNIVYVAEDECVAAAEGTLVQHPITRIMFKGVYDRQSCPRLTCYIPCGRDDDDDDDDEQ